MEDIDFWVNLNFEFKFEKLGLEGKISWTLNIFTLPNLENFNSENVKNKNVFTLEPNKTSYINLALNDHMFLELV